MPGCFVADDARWRPFHCHSAGVETPNDQALAFTLTGKGVQIYAWGPVPDVPDKFGWVLKAPEADLFDADGKTVGRHFAGPRGS